VQKFIDDTTVIPPPARTPIVKPSVPVCPVNQILIDGVCRANNQPLQCQVTIEKGSSVSQVTFVCDANNQGLIANSTIKEGATVSGGVLTSYIINEGTLANFDFRGVSIVGGTLAGYITNTSAVGGWFENVHLAANTVLKGGRLKGEIIGDSQAPALLQQLRIETGARLSDVTLGRGVRVADGVTLGEGVTFFK
jgi:hypothetical protein